MPNYQEIEKDLIPNLKTFNHANSMSARISGDFYQIWSYSTIIATVCLSNPAIQWVNDGKYSRTTSRQQSLVKRALATFNSRPYIPTV